MTLTPERHALHHAHRGALACALAGLNQRELAAEEWTDLRRVRNEFTHDAPEIIEERFSRQQLTIRAARRVVKVLDDISGKIARWFPVMLV